MKLTYRNIFIFLLAGYVVFEFMFFNSIVGVDEPWYANVAYNFAQGNGLVDTIARDGSHWTAFLYPLILGLGFKLFGTSVFTGRLVSLLGGAVALSGFIQIQKFWKIKPWVIFFTGALFIVSNMYHIIFRNIRPEAWCVAFAIWAFFFLVRGVEENRVADFMISALLTSCAIFCHPNAVLYALLYGLFVLGVSCHRKSVGPVIGFGAVGLICVVGWILYYTLGCGEDLTLFLTKSAGTRTTAGSGSFVGAFLDAVPEFARGYSTGLKRLYIFVFETGILVTGLFFAQQNRRLFFVSLGGLLYFLLALLVFSPLSTIHFGEVVFFSLLATGLILQQLEARKMLLTCFCLIIGVYGLNGVAGSAVRIHKHFRNTPMDEIAEQIRQKIPENSKILSLMPFWFGLKHTDFYSDYTRWEQKGYAELDEFLKKGNPGYVVISSCFIKDSLEESAQLRNKGALGRSLTHLEKLIVDGNEREQLYYRSVVSFAEQQGVPIFALNTRGYGEIKIWRIKE